MRAHIKIKLVNANTARPRSNGCPPSQHVDELHTSLTPEAAVIELRGVVVVGDERCG